MTCRVLWFLVAVLAVAGCGRSTPPRSEAPREDPTLRFEILDDTTGLSRGRPLLAEFDLYRDPEHGIHARGRISLPEGARLQLTVFTANEGKLLGRTQFAVEDGRFDSPPLTGPGGRLSQGLYRFELFTIFDTAWQPPEVMVATDNGRALRGPGVFRGRNGIPAFIHAEDQRL